MADEIVRVSQQQTKPIKIAKWKIRQGVTVPVGRIILLYDFLDLPKVEQKKLKACQAGIIHKILAEEGKVVQPGEPLYEFKSCSHPTIMIDMCAECGADLRKDDNIKTKTTASVPMIHAIPELKVSEEQAQKIGQADNDRLIKDRKLVLLVDLDQTLIHTTNDNIPPNLRDVYHFQLYGPKSPWYHTRLRPGTHKFLNSICKFYELHICTFGARNYAHMIAEFLDPDQKFFSNRILSRDECFDPTSKKANLKALFPCGDNMVCIIDDREDVWSCALNLIHVKPYHFFQHTGDINAPPGLDKHEADDKDGVDLTKIVKKALKKKEVEEIEINQEKNVTKDIEDKNESSINKDTNGEDKKDNVEKLCKSKGMEDIQNYTIVKTEKTNEKMAASEEIKEIQIENKENPENDEKAEKDNEASENNKQATGIHQADNDLLLKDNTIQKIDNEEASNETKDKPSESENNGEKIVHENNQKLEDKDIATPQIPSQEDLLIDIEDPDDYLTYLEDILRRIYKVYYELLDNMESGKIPDLKRVIPFVKRKVLNGCKLVFSGLVPTHYKLEQSKAFQVAKSLGAEVQADLDDETTHLVAVRPGTAKVNAGRRKKNLAIVTADWLWCCAERWEHVDEKIFPLNSKGSKNRHPPPHCSSPEHIASYPEHDTPALRKRTPSGRFMDTINPLMSFSSDDIANMDKEVGDILDDESDDTDEEKKDPTDEDENDTNTEVNFKHMMQTQILGAYTASRDWEDDDGEQKLAKESSDEDEDNSKSQSKRKRTLEDSDEDNSQDFELPSSKFRRGGDLYELDAERDEDDNDTSSFGAPDEEDEGEWNMMGAALEREFLSD
ncbi:unnamed protein product [Ceutorhynchus assimilis]|uniref:RNA polymerase II subunit A C-terminal domain phosphatase n=1 Tax=Ceutorhynchus assimilis TaxID=467358 RepID=A0A9N9QNY3_9CUCU|nr:unnamed protein product [Ceutorhynchus assimilis]